MIKPIDPGIRLDGFVLAGGASSRMGKDKAQMTIGGMKLFERAATALSEICHQSVSLVGRYGTYDPLCTELDIADLPDLRFGGRNLLRAPIIGLYTALTEAKTPWITVLACDLPFVTGDLMTKLSGFCSDEFDAVVPVQPDERPQPLCAFYRRESCLPAVERMLFAGDLKLQRLMSHLRTRFVNFEEISALPGSAHFFLNVNTIENYESAQKIITS